MRVSSVHFSAYYGQGAAFGHPSSIKSSFNNTPLINFELSKDTVSFKNFVSKNAASALSGVKNS